MRSLLLLVSLSVLLVGTGSAHAARPRPHRAPTCAAKGSVTVALNPQARVYERAQRGDADQHLLIGCLLRSGRTTQLESWFSCDCSRGDEIGPQAWSRGTVVAINRWSCPPDPLVGGICSGGARSFDLRTRRTLRRANTGTSVAALVIGPRGSFAYVSSGGAVAKSDASGEGTLDATPGVDPSSLAIAGSRVYWTRDGTPQSALLTPETIAPAATVAASSPSSGSSAARRWRSSASAITAAAAITPAATEKAEATAAVTASSSGERTLEQRVAGSAVRRGAGGGARR